ncbi:MAG: hypothetical protein OHK0029_20690 [Armatimonadaceae bacterium]
MQRPFNLSERILWFGPGNNEDAVPGFSPLDLPGLWAWYDAAHPDSVRNGTGGVAANGEAVAEWRDRSGNSRSVTQETAVNRPTLTVAATRHLQFTPTPEARFLEYLSPETLAQPNTIFLVGARDSAGQRVFLDGATGSQHAVYTESNLWGIFAGTVRTGGTPDTDRHLLRAVFHGASSSLAVDGVAVVSGDAGSESLGTVRFGLNAAGTGYALEGHLCEVIVVHGLLTAAQVTACEDYLRGKWL